MMGILVTGRRGFGVNWYDGDWTYGKLGYVYDMQSKV